MKKNVVYSEATQKEIKKTVAVVGFIVVLAVVLFVLYSSVVITKSNEYSVIKQFGSIVRVEKNAGLSFRIPVLQQVAKVDREFMYYDIPSSDVITSDKKTMIVDSYVIWKITDPEKFMKTLSGSNSNAESRLDTIVYNAIKNTISSMTQDEVIVSRDGKMTISTQDEEAVTNDIEIDDEEKPTTVEIVSLTDVITNNIADCSDYGIEVVKTEIKVLDLPASNKEAVYNRMVSERKNVSTSYEAQGKAEAQKIRNTTDKEVAVMEAEAKVAAEKVVAEGEAEYMKILSDAYNDPDKADFYSFIKALDAAKNSLAGENNTLVLDESSPLTQIFYGKY